MGAGPASGNGLRKVQVENVMKRNLLGRALVVAALACFPSVAYAHTEGGGAGFLSGLMHPVFGLDHFLAMLGVGIVSAQLGGRRIITVPATFVLSMVAGAVAGIYGYQWSFSEVGIALSVVILGFAITTAKENGNSWAVMLVVALFGSLHGHAHGLEMPNTADPVFYGAGFLASTTAIHLLGVGIGHVSTTRASFLPLLRHTGSVMSGMGLMILLDSISRG
jgi:urease accessory protein